MKKYYTKQINEEKYFEMFLKNKFQEQSQILKIIQFLFQQILESSHKTIESSVMFLDGELKDSSEQLEQLIKKKKTKNNSKTAQDVPKSMQVSLFVPFVSMDTLDTLDFL